MVQPNKMKLVHKLVLSLRHDRRMSKLSIFLVFGMGLVQNHLFRCPTLFSFDVHTDMGMGSNPHKNQGYWGRSSVSFGLD